MSKAEIRRLLDAHYASMSDTDEVEMSRRVSEGADVASLALRTCGCGVAVDGFYEYLDHLKEVIEFAGRDAGAGAGK